MVTVGGIISGGFDLLRRRPLAALVWGIIYVAASALGLFAMLVPMMQFAMANAGAQAAPDPAMFMQMFGQMYLFFFLLMIVMVILLTAGLRAALRPEESSFASLRLGMDELRMVGLFLLFAIAGFVLMMVMSIVFGIVFGAMGMFGSMTRGGQPGGGFILMMLLIYALPLFLTVRLAPAFALTVMRRKIVIGEAWTLTSGHFWVMFGGYLVLNLMIFIIYMVLAFAVVSPVMMMMVGANPAGAMELMQGHVGGGIAAAILVFGLIFAILAGVSLAFNAGGLAAATRSLTGDTDEDLAETFA
ncbi:MAG: hypothetical protein JWL96_2580 [Sphingomonas bacterium]|uniref:hypothetical protein n=1 Tax=Sphingomonas bacterium TaxID=1895847 RepID=UPI0026233DA6|nr:hypothetical protein [Sphingomonas bacterium]MDB5710510.1 hypothetical protein [Sphingomonas bacterium]